MLVDSCRLIMPLSRGEWRTAENIHTIGPCGHPWSKNGKLQVVQPCVEQLGGTEPDGSKGQECIPLTSSWSESTLEAAMMIQIVRENGCSS